MEYAFFWIVFAILVGIFASMRRARNGFGWFLLAMLISPLLAFLLCAALGPSPRSRRKCPACAEYIKREAARCKHCGQEAPPLAT